MEVPLSATPKGNGFQARIALPNGVSISSAESFPAKAEAIVAAADWKPALLPADDQRRSTASASGITV